MIAAARYEALIGVTLVALVACGGEDDAVENSGSGGQSGTLIRTAEGPVSGKLVDKTRAFLGIPFAAAPEGPLRWKSPRPVASWTAPLDATAFGPGCPQAAQGFTAVNPVAQSENCLLLNVWTPEPAPEKPLPVMVWIHGGGFFAGTSYGAEYARAGDDPYYDGRLLSENGVVVVSMGYRLGPFGFLAHPSLAGEDAAHPAAGNYGIEDQRAALQWVQRNAAAFGGDPSNVTIFGESAGGSSVCMHIVSPLSRNLFQRAILESGPCSLFESSKDAATNTATSFAEQRGCADPATAMECLRGKSTEELLANTTSAATLRLPWVPSLDGLNFPKTPFELLAAGDVARVPTISGTNDDEGTLFQAVGSTPAPTTAADYEAGVRAEYGANADKVLELYPASAYAKPGDALADIRGDSTFVCPTRRFVRANVRAGNPTYRYTFTHAGTPLGATLGAFHGSEIRFVFGTSLLGNPVTAEEGPLLRAFQGYWTRHAASGDPNGAGATPWPRSTAEADEHIMLDLEVSSASGLKTEKCDFWDSLP